MTLDLKSKITEIIKTYRDGDRQSYKIADEIAALVDADIAQALRLQEVDSVPLGEILDSLDMEIRSKS